MVLAIMENGNQFFVHLAITELDCVRRDLRAL